MNRYAQIMGHVVEHGCSACRGEIEQLGPELGPDPRPRDTSRWSMSREEWAGQEPVDAPVWERA